jgi:hypothetical protein
MSWVIAAAVAVSTGAQIYGASVTAYMARLSLLRRNKHKLKIR